MFAQDEGGEGLVGFAEVQINLKDVNDNAVSNLALVDLGVVNEKANKKHRNMI